MSLVHDGANYLMTLKPNGVNSPEVVDVSYISPQPVNVLNITPHKYSSHSPLTRRNKENTFNCNVPREMTTKKPTWAPGKPLSPKAQEIIKSGKGRPSDVPPFKWICLTCNRCLRDEGGLEQHIQTVHGARTFACPHTNCNKIFKRKDHLSMHVMTIHEGRKPCKTCKGTVTFKSKEELHQHKLQVHGPSAGPVKQGSSKLPPYKCASCDFVTERKESMDDHTNTAHLQNPLVPAPAASIVFRCEPCAWNFGSQYYLKLHLQQVHGITNPTEDRAGSVSHVNAGTTNNSTYILPSSSQLNNFEPKMEINNHEDIIQEVMGHDIFKGLQGDLLDESLGRYSANQPTNNTSIGVMPPVESQQPHNFESPNVYMNFQDISGHYNTPSVTTVQPLHGHELANSDNLGMSHDLNLCDMKSVGITY